MRALEQDVQIACCVCVLRGRWLAATVTGAVVLVANVGTTFLLAILGVVIALTGSDFQTLCGGGVVRVTALPPATDRPSRRALAGDGQAGRARFSLRGMIRPYRRQLVQVPEQPLADGRPTVRRLLEAAEQHELERGQDEREADQRRAHASEDFIRAKSLGIVRVPLLPSA